MQEPFLLLQLLMMILTMSKSQCLVMPELSLLRLFCLQPLFQDLMCRLQCLCLRLSFLLSSFLLTVCEKP
jgi:hypothetical protein